MPRITGASILKYIIQRINHMKLAIYVHYSPDEKIHKYEQILLESLSKYFDKLMVVVNGNISELECTNLKSLRNTEIFIRSNEGYDFHGWKDALNHLGWDDIKSYDEILLTNNTFYGPIFPLEDLFLAMRDRECDFWGISKHPALNKNFIKNDQNTAFLEHIQSFWIVFKHSIIVSNAFKEFWQNLPIMPNFAIAVGYGEIALTNYFESKGYKSASFLDANKYHQLLRSNPCLFSDLMVTEDQCPIIKRKFFYDFLNAYPDNGWCGNYRARKLLNYLYNRKLFDCNIILDDLLTIAKPSLLQKSLEIDYVISADHEMIVQDCFHLKKSSADKYQFADTISNSDPAALVNKLVIIFDLAHKSDFVVCKSKILEFNDSNSKDLGMNVIFITVCSNLSASEENSLKAEIGDLASTVKATGYLISDFKDILPLINTNDQYVEYIGYFSTKILKSEDPYTSLLKKDWYADNFMKNHTYVNNLITLLSDNASIGLLAIKDISSANLLEAGGSCFWTTSEIFKDIAANKKMSLDQILIRHHKLLGSYISQQSLISQGNFVNDRINQTSLAIEKSYDKLKKYLLKICMFKILSTIFFWKKDYFVGKIGKTFNKIRKLVGIYRSR